MGTSSSSFTRFIYKNKNKKILTSEKNAILYLLSIDINVFERLHIVHGENAEKSLARAHVLIAHRTVLLLAGRVEYVEQARLAVDYDLLPIRILYGKKQPVSPPLDRKKCLPLPYRQFFSLSHRSLGRIPRRN